MTRTEEMARYLQWDIRNWSRAVDFWQSNTAGVLPGADVLELGSRDGGLSLWFADQGARRVVCSDLHGPSDAARTLHAQAGISSRIEYASIDATDIGQENAYDVVAFKSVLGGVGGQGGLDAQAAAVRSMYSALRPGGTLLFAENLKASPMHTVLRRRFVKWGDRWRYVTVEEMHSFLEPFTRVRDMSFGLAGAFGRTERQRDGLARLDIWGLDRTVPQRWRYVIAGVATK